MELKKPLTYDEQVDRLISAHNLTINDRGQAIEILKQVNYYRLTAYGIGLKKKEDREKYHDNISIEHLYRLYKFDSKFRNMLIHIIETIEIQLRTQISNYLALKYGAEGYKDATNFISKKNKDGEEIHSVVIKSFEKECARHSKYPFVKHHFEKYEGHFPIWAAVELFTFGNIGSLFDIMKDEDRKVIACLYNTHPSHLNSWILSLIEVRNVCAHYGRLYNMPLKQTPFLYSEDKKYINPKRSKIYPVLLVIKRIMNNNLEWKSFVTELEALVEQYSDVLELKFMDFPRNWDTILTNEKNK